MDKELKEFLETKFGEMNYEFTKVNDRLDGMEVRLEAVESRLDGVEVRLEAVESRLDGVELRLDRIETRQESTESMVTQLISMTADVKTSVDYGTKRIDRHTHQIADIQEVLDLREN